MANALHLLRRALEAVHVCQQGIDGVGGQMVVDSNASTINRVKLVLLGNVIELLACERPAELHLKCAPERQAGQSCRRGCASGGARACPASCGRRSLLSGGLLLSVAAAGYVACMVGEVWLPTYLERTISLTLIPWMIGALFIIGHDAAHNSFTPYSWLNRLLARLVLLPAWHPYTSWVYAHNTLHHGGTNLRGKHPDFVPLTKEEYDRLPRWRRLLEKLYRSPWGSGPSYLVGFYLGYILFPTKERRPPRRRQFEWDRLLVLGFFALQIAGMYLLASPQIGAVFAAAPLRVSGCDPYLGALGPIHGLRLFHSAHPSPTCVV